MIMKSKNFLFVPAAFKLHYLKITEITIVTHFGVTFSELFRY